ncbi:MAG TPA: 2OG-Fe(II) oxygenase [Pirellulales bacterium]
MDVLDLEAFRRAPLVRRPFEHLVLPGFIKPPARSAIIADYPRIENPGSFPVNSVSHGPAFGRLLDELNGDEMRAAFEEKFALDLSGRPTMITARGRCCLRDGRIHTDSQDKIITVLVYFNPPWEQPGGRLRLLLSADDLENVVAEVPPDEGTLVCFRRSHNSYHGHKPFVGERRVVQFNWVTSNRSARAHLLRHRFSAIMKRLVPFASLPRPETSQRM